MDTPDKKMQYTVPLKVLVVEDNEVDRKMIIAMLTESADHTSLVKGTNNLKGALKLLDEHDFDVVMLDLNLPDSKGVKTLSELNKYFPDITIVVNTGAYEDDLGLRTLSFGAQDFLIKGKYNAYVLNKVLHYSMERKRLELELKDAYAKLKEAQSQLIQTEKMKVVGSLASGVAHEVKNPLATILYGATYLSNHLKMDDDKVKSVVENIKEATHRANDIITDLLDFSSISRIEMKGENINEVIEKALSLIHHEFEKNHIKVIKEFKTDIPEIELDRNKIEQVLINLMLNSISAMSSGGQLELRSYTKKLTKDLEEVPGGNGNKIKAGENVIIVNVDDVGCGIPDDKKDKIFDPFFTTRRGNGGVGLGLAVSQNIMDNHGGKIYIENKKEGGARATLIFKV